MNLTALQHSAFLQSLGWAIANSLWQAAALWIAYYLINASYKNASSKFRTNLSTALLFSIFTWFTITFLQKYLLLKSELAAVSAQTVFAEYVTPSKTFFSWQLIITNVVKVLPYLSIAYLFLLVVLAFRLIKSYRHIYFIKANGLHKAGVEWRVFAEKVANHIGIHKKIKVWLSDHVDVPATIGFFKPIILIPIASINQLSVEQMEAVILHELSHIKRNDYVINLFISLIETILFFNPFVVLLAKIIKRERENCCDDFVIQYQYDRHSYASALLSLEQYRNKNYRLVLSSTSGKKQLLHRVKRIMEVSSSNSNFNYGQKLLALLLITGIICSVAWLSPEKKQGTVKQQTVKNWVKPNVETNKKTQSIAKTVDNALKEIVITAKVKKQQAEVNLNEDQPDNSNWNDEQSAGDKKETNEMSFFTDNLKPNAVKQLKELGKNNFTFKTGTSFPPAVAAQFYKNGAFEKLKTTQFLNELPATMQKWKVDLGDVSFFYSYEWKKIQEEVQKNLEDIQKEMTLAPAEKRKMAADLERELQDKIQRAVLQGRLKKQPNIDVTGMVTVAPHINQKIYLMTDSLRAAGMNVLNVYTNERQQVRTRRSENTSDCPEVKQKIERTPRGNTYGYSYSVNGSEFDYIDNTTPPTPVAKKPAHSNVKVICKDGVVYINGKKVILPTEENPVQGVFKTKKLFVTDDNKNVMEIQVDN